MDIEYTVVFEMILSLYVGHHTCFFYYILSILMMKIMYIFLHRLSKFCCAVQKYKSYGNTLKSALIWGFFLKYKNSFWHIINMYYNSYMLLWCNYQFLYSLIIEMLIYVISINIQQNSYWHLYPQFSLLSMLIA